MFEVKEKTRAKILLREPFALPYPEDRRQLREDLDPKIIIVRSLTGEFKATLLPLDSTFNSAAVYKEDGFWAMNGVHPTMAGYALITKALLSRVKGL